MKKVGLVDAGRREESGIKSKDETHILRGHALKSHLKRTRPEVLTDTGTTNNIESKQVASPRRTYFLHVCSRLAFQNIGLIKGGLQPICPSTYIIKYKEE